MNLFCSPFLHDADPVVRVANLDVSAGVQQLAAVAVQYKSFVLDVQLAAGFLTDWMTCLSSADTIGPW